MLLFCRVVKEEKSTGLRCRMSSCLCSSLLTYLLCSTPTSPTSSTTSSTTSTSTSTTTTTNSRKPRTPRSPRSSRRTRTSWSTRTSRTPRAPRTSRARWTSRSTCPTTTTMSTSLCYSMYSNLPTILLSSKTKVKLKQGSFRMRRKFFLYTFLLGVFSRNIL